MNQAQQFFDQYVGAIETSHDFNKYVSRAYNRCSHVAVAPTPAFIFTFDDTSQIKADAYGFMVL